MKFSVFKLVSVLFFMKHMFIFKMCLTQMCVFSQTSKIKQSKSYLMFFKCY